MTKPLSGQRSRLIPRMETGWALVLTPSQSPLRRSAAIQPSKKA